MKGNIKNIDNSLIKLFYIYLYNLDIKCKNAILRWLQQGTKLSLVVTPLQSASGCRTSRFGETVI